MQNTIKFWLFNFIVLVLFGCKKEKTTTITTWEGFKLPSHFPEPISKISTAEITQSGFELGKKLFYDPILSRNNTISCGSCHIQGSAFTHHGHDISHGIDDKLGRRNTPSIQNLIWQSSYFWDGGVHNIDLIPLSPIQNPVEMDETPTNVISKLKSSPIYPNLFQKAFGSSEITSAKFLNAMAQFMAMLVSSNSRYDKFLRGEISLNEDEKLGLKSFQEKCASCHAGVLQTDNSFRNNGITNDFNYDKGRYEISQLNDDIGKVKVPSLRNIEKTTPYMHNGQINTLEGVLDFYDLNVKDSNTLDPILKKNNRLGIAFSSEEKRNIVAFLKTLTDDDFIRNPLFAEF